MTIFNEGANWHLSQSSIKTFIKVLLWNHAQIRSWNQPVLSNKGKVSCSMKQRGPLMGFEPKLDTLWVRRAIHFATPSTFSHYTYHSINRSNVFQKARHRNDRIYCPSAKWDTLVWSSISELWDDHLILAANIWPDLDDIAHWDLYINSSLSVCFPI